MNFTIFILVKFSNKSFLIIYMLQYILLFKELLALRNIYVLRFKVMLLLLSHYRFATLWICIRKIKNPIFRYINVS